MTQGISGTLLLDEEVINDPYPFYRRLHAEAPVWDISGTGLFAVSTFELLAEAAAGRRLFVEYQLPALPRRRRSSPPALLR